VGLRDVGRRRLAAQLGNPHGRFGRFVARELNRRNRPLMTAAVAALELRPGQAAADIGFGGGAALRLLLDGVAPDGQVRAVDRSRTAVTGAKRSYAADIATGRLSVDEASLTALPLPDSSLDAVMTLNTVYFVDDAQLGRGFGEFARVLRPGGRLVIGIGDPAAMARQPLMTHGFRVRSLHDLETAATAAGLSPVGRQRSQTNDDVPHHVLVFRRD
jgi:SAM-dependent methyltransferase